MNDYSISNSDHQAPLYDLSQLKNVAQGNQQFVDKMIRIFLQQAPISVQEINKAFGAHDFNKIMQVAHKIKPMIDMMGITSLKKEVKLLAKESYQDKDLKELEILVSHFTNMVNQVIECIKKDKNIIS